MKNGIRDSINEVLVEAAFGVIAREDLPRLSDQATDQILKTLNEEIEKLPEFWVRAEHIKGVDGQYYKPGAFISKSDIQSLFGEKK